MFGGGSRSLLFIYFSFELTSVLQEVVQKLLKRVELWEEGGQFVEVVKRHGDIFGVSAHIDDL